MIGERKIIAIIPARGGSKGLPGKNIMPLCGRPLIGWTIEAGLKSKYIDEVVVSTDSVETAAVAREYGASTPFLRPKELAEDTTPSFNVLEHTLFFYRDRLGKQYDYVLMLEPTSPLRDEYDIDSAIQILIANCQATALVGISKTESQNPAFLVSLDANNCLVGYENKEMKVLRRQDISNVYFFEGSLYLSEVDFLLEKKTFYHEKTFGYEFPKWKSLEIDDLDDFTMVEALMKKRSYK